MDFIVIDFETTGLGNDDTIIEIGYVWIKDGAIKRSSSTLINPLRTISSRITQITGITNEMIKGAPILSEVIVAFEKFVRGKIIVAHNASFDMRFLNNALKDNNIIEIDRYLCTMKMFKVYKEQKGLVNKGSKLSDLTEFFNLNNSRAHRALEDAEVTAKAFLLMCKSLDFEEIITYKK